MPTSKTAAAHTPGPWRAEKLENECEYDIMDPTGAYIAMTFGVAGGRPDAEGVANAHLIAAAPDLLAVCQALEAHCVNVERLQGDNHAAEGQRLREQMRAAIARAEGR